MAASALTPVTVLAGFEAGAAGASGIVTGRSTKAAAGGARLFRSDVVGLHASCICCALSDDLVRALRELHAERTARGGAGFDRVAVEVASGEDLRPIMAALAELPLVAARFAASAIVVA